ncbi:diaminohydroxyphosphoribosylaminopyrimidine reductase [Halobellus salinus]|uniref:2,5-diamino-6-(ribosylamino)-4(3H)-pyrimidinone 5'-phosphate reductase n=1 Tax=Halobellus salinus TaxID=931585 RepID=A0A830EEJ6_9EURY|nr:2,5-diamino-6-(ribosylamino)-4(3H)-pyrimidinone 5'-phosphate reductase [Halobellus salinus]GGI97525.1 diaminohydroxyphosphoribosylaminopyrimidine reductase [Halobellus salinus]SMP07364.1 2,5-diamino-6-(5-phosphoribosylamino)pyrimidin-4(3H)-one reductase [Halobellus salinus]
MHVFVNAAASADGKLSTRRREQVRISGPEDFARVDRLRAGADAVLVGVGTVLADDPHLTVDDSSLRAARTDRDDPATPARVVLDSTGRTPTDARILDNAATTYAVVSSAATRSRRQALADAGAEVVVAGDDRVALDDAVSALATRGIETLMIEGGGEVIYSFFAAGLVDELSVYVGSVIVGGRDAPTLADGDGFVGSFPDLSLEDVRAVDDGVLLEYTVTGRSGANG